MKAQNNPIDITSADIKKFKDPIEDILVGYYYQSSKHSMPDLILQLDPQERYVMNDIERGTYLALREGFQVFRAVYDLLSEKVELKQRIISSPDQQNDSILDSMRGFCGNFATFSAAIFIIKRIDLCLQHTDVSDSSEEIDLQQIQLQTELPEEMLMRRLLAPIMVNLIKHKENNQVFTNETEFPIYCKDVLSRYIHLAREQSVRFQAFNQHLHGYRFRILDDFVALEEYQDVAMNVQIAVVDQAAFQPIKADEIVGNRAAKSKLLRYMDRLALYDLREEKNPILDLGGLSWTNLFDGPPGTGKSSLFRLAMTRLQERSQGFDLPYNIVMVDQSIKDEFYGKTGKLLLERLKVTQDTQALSLVIFDDIDLLTSTRSDAQGADNDINNIIMQYLDGVFTVRRGNVINFAASNKPTGLDSAMRNRFSDRLLIDGPVRAEDFSDIFNINARAMMANNLIEIEQGYTPFAAQKPDAVEDVAAYMAEELSKYKQASVMDFGAFMYELKKKNELITGRSSKAIMDAVLERSANFDIPSDWFSDTTLYYNQSYVRKLEMIRELYQPISADILFQEAQRYFDSEQRYAQTEAQEQIDNSFNRIAWDIQAKIQYYRQQIQQGQSGASVQLQQLQNELETLLQGFNQ